MDLSALPRDELSGHILQVGAEASVLVVGAPRPPLPGDVLHRGPVVVRYGFPLLMKRDTLLVAWVYDDFRREHRGADALDFILRSGDLFPRADVGGWQVSTGRPVEMFLKQLDVTPGIEALAYSGEAISRPLARLAMALWADASVTGWHEPSAGDMRVPALLHRAVPCFVVHPAALGELPHRLLRQTSR